jgi:hypothetical protein
MKILKSLVQLFFNLKIKENEMLVVIPILFVLSSPVSPVPSVTSVVLNNNLISVDHVVTVKQGLLHRSKLVLVERRSFLKSRFTDIIEASKSINLKRSKWRMFAPG